MKTYKLITLYRRGLWLWSTDRDVIDQLFADLKQHIPSAQLSYGAIPDEFAGQRLRVRFEKLQNKDEGAFWWIVTWLCHHGWEPIHAGLGNEVEYHFKQTVEDA
jgi:hypothetical protein